MPSKADHISKAEHNEKFASTLNSDGSYADYRDWVVTAYFYSAIHYVEAYLSTLSRHSPDHRARDAVIGSDPDLQPIYSDYRRLKDDSTNARYSMWTPTPLDVANGVQPGHAAIKAHLLSIIS